MSYLENIHSPDDVKKLNIQDLNILCSEIREFLINNISRSGGHLASNLGVVELTVALHKVFNTSTDRLIFDVGHQCYTHKILTGRRDSFNSLRSIRGLSGYQKTSESIHDPFGAGHASTSVSAALGMARARTLTGGNYHVIAVIGDGALTGGLAYEALNDAGQSKERMIVILNDNEMSIQKNVGGVERQLGRLRLKPQYSNMKNHVRRVTDQIPFGKRIYKLIHNTKVLIKSMLIHGSMFEDMGFTYLGPVNGHDLKALCNLLQIAKGYSGPVLIHLTTVKGKGYKFSEEKPSYYHAISKFDVSSGKQCKPATCDFSTVFGRKLVALAENNPRICAVTASMQSATGLDPFAARYPKRFFDVGIAEGHAVTMAAGMAMQGMIPVCAVYSTFLQRAYDMIIHDVALQRLHVIFAIDRAGIVGEDGETHQGVFDASFLPQIPGMKVYCPSGYAELEAMLEEAVLHCDGPVAVRYPRGSEGAYTAVSTGDSQIVRTGNHITLVTYGRLINEVTRAAELLSAGGLSAEIVKINLLSPLDVDRIESSVRKTGRLSVIEESVEEGGAGRRILSELLLRGVPLKRTRLINPGNRFIPQGSVQEIFAQYGLDAETICAAAMEDCSDEKKDRPAAV